ncbi:MAG: redoxin domain-containing protein [Planctomycetes bacterium]|nr:redoxin domain-containing protein [Planctomycetota bacterium]
MRSIVRFILLVAVSFAGASCKSTMIFEALRGGVKVFPDLLNDQPTVMAFLSANDRRCDKEIPSLLALYYREDTPVQVVGVLVFDEFEFVNQITTLNQAAFTVLLDPERRLVEKYRIVNYPTYVYLSPRGKEIDRVEDIRLARRWVDFPRWHEKAAGQPKESAYRGR